MKPEDVAEMKPEDVADLADTVAQAMYGTTSQDGEVWDDLTENERDDFRLAAHAAIAAHIGWMEKRGWAMVKLRKKNALDIAKPKLIGMH
jgi:hypothetical protein